MSLLKDAKKAYNMNISLNAKFKKIGMDEVNKEVIKKF